MKRLKSAVSLMLVLALILSVVYIPAMAAEAVEPSISVEGRKLTDAERSDFDIADTDVYGLFFIGNGGIDKDGNTLGICVASTVFSYDSEVILPYNKRIATTEMGTRLLHPKHMKKMA